MSRDFYRLVKMRSGDGARKLLLDFPLACQEKTRSGFMSFGSFILDEDNEAVKIKRADIARLWPHEGTYGWLDREGRMWSAPYAKHITAATHIVDYIFKLPNLRQCGDCVLEDLGWLHCYGDSVAFYHKPTQAQVDWMYDTLPANEFKHVLRRLDEGEY